MHKVKSTAASAVWLGLASFHAYAQQTYQPAVLHSFSAYPQGNQPNSGLVRDASGNLYGTTFYGGDSGRGTVFKVDPSGNETVLFSFSGAAQGAGPNGVVFDAQGDLYGTT